MTTTPITSGSPPHATSPAPAPNPAISTAVVVLSSLPPVLPPAPPPGPAQDTEADEWATKINDAVGEGLAWILDAGSLLREAKGALPHGQWMVMFTSKRIQIGLRTAEMLMRIAAHRALIDSQNLAKLPPSLTTLDVLAGGSVEVVNVGIQTGEIDPAITAKEARKFIRTHSPSLAHAPRAAKFDVAKRLNCLDAALWKELEKWPDEALGQFAEKLVTFVEEVRNYAPHPEQ